MAVILQPRGAWPGVQPVGRVDPGLPVYEEHVEAVVESHNYLSCYYGRSHLLQGWLGRGTSPALAVGEIEVAVAGLVAVLEVPIIPRGPATAGGVALRVRYILDSDADVRLQATCLEDASVVTTPWMGAAGVQYGATTLVYAASRADTATTIQILIEANAAGTWAALYGLALHDFDLAAPP